MWARYVRVAGCVLVKVLVLGGTKFLGRAIVEAALGHGHNVTLFNRGMTNPELFPGLKTIVGNRRVDAAKLESFAADVVIDVAGMTPDDVTPTVDVLHDSVGRYVFISTVSVYTDHSVPQVEGQAVIPLADGLNPGDAYGAGKAAAEAVVIGAFGDRGLVIRPGLIVGPHDPTDRFAYWPRRVARGGRVLAPGGPEHPAQFIDVRDLACWVVTAAEQSLHGLFNATGDPTTLGRLLRSCQDTITGSQAILAWVGDDDLLATGVSPWMGVPLWIAVPGWEAHAQVDNNKARDAGLSFRPLDQTIRATLAWDLARGGPPSEVEGLTPEREEQLLSALVR
jgi:2'-hydroxyisoflavone reductase